MLLTVWAAPTYADFNDGVAAYERNDYVTALREFLPLARQGNPLAQFNVGLIYQHGLGVKPDLAEAIKWYERAAENDDAQAQRVIGDMYIEGVWGNADYATAAQWYKLAAEFGDAEAQRKLGALYLQGQGVERNRDTAMKWLRLSGKQDDAVARRLLNETRATLPGHDLPASQGGGSPSAKGVTSIASCRGRFTKAPYKINVQTVFPEAPINHSHSIAELSYYSGKGPGMHILGLMKPDLSIETRSSTDGAKVGKAFCFWITGFDVTLRYRRVDIYVAREYPKGSCAYNAILDHEKEHVVVARENLEEYAPRIRKVLTSWLIPTGKAPIMVESPQQAKTEVQAIAKELLKPVYEEMLVSLADGQASFDTPDEYTRVRNRCQNWWYPRRRPWPRRVRVIPPPTQWR